VSYYGLRVGSTALSAYYSLQVAVYNRTASPLPCVLAQPAQFAFCLITGTAVSGDQSLATFTTVSSGVINTTSPSASTYGSFTAAALSGTQYTSSNPTPVPVSLAAAGSLPGYYSNLNDNGFSLSGSSLASTDYEGLGLVSSYGSFVLYDQTSVTCSSGTCGQYGKLFVQQITATQPASSLPCAPAASVAQLQMCLITGSISGTETEQTFTTVTSAIVNLTITAETLIQQLEYTEEYKAVTVASIVSGSSYNSTSGVVAPLSLAAPGSVPGYDSVEPNDNTIQLEGYGYHYDYDYYSGNALRAYLDTAGIGFNVSGRLFSVSSQGLYENGVRLSDSYNLRVALYNGSEAPLPCAPAQPVQFAFCLITGSAATGAQTLDTYATVSYAATHEKQ
jgi:hypothetical protein